MEESHRGELTICDIRIEGRLPDPSVAKVTQVVIIFELYTKRGNSETVRYRTYSYICTCVVGIVVDIIVACGRCYLVWRTVDDMVKCFVAGYRRFVRIAHRRLSMLLMLLMLLLQLLMLLLLLMLLMLCIAVSVTTGMAIMTIITMKTTHVSYLGQFEDLSESDMWMI